MMPETSQAPRLVVYDGDCPVCRATAERLRGRSWSVPHEVIAFQSLEPGLAEEMAAAGVDRRMLIFDPASGEVTGGLEAVREVEAATGRGWVARLLGLPGINQTAALAYRLFAVNRRLLSPVPDGIECACDPRPAAWERALLWLALLAPVLALALLIPPPGRTGWLVLCGAWLAASFGGLLPGRPFARILGQLAVAMSVAALVGIAVWLLGWLAGRWWTEVGSRRPILTLAGAWWVGAILLIDRLRTIGSPRLIWPWLTLTFGVLLVASASWCPLR